MMDVAEGLPTRTGIERFLSTPPIAGQTGYEQSAEELQAGKMVQFQQMLQKAQSQAQEAQKQAGQEVVYPQTVGEELASQSAELATPDVIEGTGGGPLPKTKYEIALETEWKRLADRARLASLRPQRIVKQ